MKQAVFVVLFAAALAGCATKSLTVKTPGAVTLPARTDPVCILDPTSQILGEIPNKPVGLVKLRKRGDRKGDILDLLADEVRASGGNVALVAKLNDVRGHGWGYFVDPKLKFNCQAAGGQLR